MDLNKLPRAIALQYDMGELVYPAGAVPQLREYTYDGCGLRTFGKSTHFASDKLFQSAFARGKACRHKKGRHIDDNRWIIHVALWAATHAARLPGDFVECGVDSGMMSIAICEWLGFNALQKDFWLFDTFAGIPEQQMTDSERNGIGGWHNQNSYEECFEQAQANFAPWPRCRLVRGIVPGTLEAFPDGRQISYLSIDMNIVAPEIAAIEFFWDRLVPGGVVLLDDYGWLTHTAQRDALDAFAHRQGAMILTLPTGQGLILR